MSKLSTLLVVALVSSLVAGCGARELRRSPLEAARVKVVRTDDAALRTMGGLTFPRIVTDGGVPVSPEVLAHFSSVASARAGEMLDGVAASGDSDLVVRILRFQEREGGDLGATGEASISLALEVRTGALAQPLYQSSFTREARSFEVARDVSDREQEVLRNRPPVGVTGALLFEEGVTALFERLAADRARVFGVTNPKS